MLTDADVLQKITDRLVRKGATITSVAGNSAQFRVERLLWRANPLAACRAGSFAFERVNGAIKISYELDVRYLIWRLGASAFALVPFILLALFVALFDKSYGFLIFFLISGLIVPPYYVFYYFRVKFLFRQAVLM
jgi:hypothetical protein